MPRLFDDLFSEIDNFPEHIEFQVKFSMIEICNEEIRDLIGEISNLDLEIKENKFKGQYIEYLKEFTVISPEELKNLMKIGFVNRKSKFKNDSISHCIYFLTFQQQNLNDLSVFLIS